MRIIVDEAEYEASLRSLQNGFIEDYEFDCEEERTIEDRRTRGKRKYEYENQNEEELEGGSVIVVNGERVDLGMLARVGDGAYEKELESMTKGMTREQVVGFMDSLGGEWCGRSERRKAVDAAVVVNLLPVNWKVEVAVRRRGEPSSLYCRRYVSPTGMQFKSCKDAAVYLRDQSLTDVAGPSEEGEMRQVNSASHVFLKSINEVFSSSTLHDASGNMPGTNDLHDVEVTARIDCFPCGLTFDDMAGLNKHLAVCHKKTTRRFNLSKPHHTLDKAQTDAAQGAIAGHDNGPQLGEPSSGSQPVVTAKVNGDGKFMTECTWCNNEFVCEGVDAETMADAAGFMCPKCKEKLCGGVERSLSRSYQQ